MAPSNANTSRMLFSKEASTPIHSSPLESTTLSSLDSTALSETMDSTTISVGAQIGDIVKIDLHMTPEHGFVPEPLFDTQGIVTFVLGWGNFLPGLHELVQGCRPGDVVDRVSIDAGWGARRQDLLFYVPRPKLEKIIAKSCSNSSSSKNHNHHNQNSNNSTDNSAPSEEIRIGSSIKLPGNMHVVVYEIRPSPDGDTSQDTIVLDANPPLAGTSYACSFRVLEVTPLPKDAFEYHSTEGNVEKVDESSDQLGDEASHSYQVTTFALGCFWGAQLAFSRMEGVVGTQVGYSQGITDYSPTYEEVCTGRTKHREAVRVVYDSQLVTYQNLMHAAYERLDQSTSSLELHKLFQGLGSAGGSSDSGDDYHDSSVQYKYGFYFHNDQQRDAALGFLNQRGNRFSVEVQQISHFFSAEDYHQHYLFKGGQSTRKGSKAMIRCFG
ncbi:hypothetical protein ACA910_019383 [Epithemia clementina (nom. ined.)]